MSAPRRLAVFAVAAALVFAGSTALGAAVGPAPAPEPAPAPSTTVVTTHGGHP